MYRSDGEPFQLFRHWKVNGCTKCRRWNDSLVRDFALPTQTVLRQQCRVQSTSVDAEHYNVIVLLTFNDIRKLEMPIHNLADNSHPSERYRHERDVHQVNERRVNAFRPESARFGHL